jgi:hypothetical protein
MNRSDSIAELAKALLSAQKEIDAAKKKAKNPFFKSSYADLSEVIDTVKEPLNNNGIVFLQIVDESENGAVVETTLLHESGQFISGRTPVFSSKPNDPQALGSGITYSKRYGLQAIVGLPTEDDDGEKAMGRTSKKGDLKELNLLIKKLGKSDLDVDKMIKFAGGNPELEELKDLDPNQIDKIVGVLRRQSK